jgi:hypothetical protein
MNINPPKALWEVMREAIVDALIYSNGNMAQAAKILMIGRTTLYRKMRDFDICESEYMPVSLHSLQTRKPAMPDRELHRTAKIA